MKILEFFWLDIIQKSNQTLLCAPVSILLFILTYFSGLFEKRDNKPRNPAHS